MNKAVLQRYARKHDISIDSVNFNTQILSSSIASEISLPENQDGIFIRGLFLEGARWDIKDKLLKESKPRELYTELPVVAVYPYKEENKELLSDSIYRCPVYCTLSRSNLEKTNFITNIELPSSKSTKHWTLRGVALVTQLNS